MAAKHRAEPEPVHTQGPQLADLVWISIRRRGIEAHRPDDDLTGCGRSMRTGVQLTALEARTEHDVTWCPRCWPGGDRD